MLLLLLTHCPAPAPMILSKSFAAYQLPKQLPDPQRETTRGRRRTTPGTCMEEWHELSASSHAEHETRKKQRSRNNSSTEERERMELRAHSYEDHKAGQRRARCSNWKRRSKSLKKQTTEDVIIFEKGFKHPTNLAKGHQLYRKRHAKTPTLPLWRVALQKKKCSAW